MFIAESRNHALETRENRAERNSDRTQRLCDHEKRAAIEEIELPNRWRCATLELHFLRQHLCTPVPTGVYLIWWCVSHRCDRFVRLAGSVVSTVVPVTLSVISLASEPTRHVAWCSLPVSWS
jgi:hypothetical protein